MDKLAILAKIKDLFAQMIALMAKTTLIEAGEMMLGKDASPSDEAPDEYGCADSVSGVIRLIFPYFKGSVSTMVLKNILDADKRFIKVSTPQPNCIILCATGEGNDPLVKNGHVGIIGKDNKIMSNSSYDNPKTGTLAGSFIYNYTLETWQKRYHSYPMHYYTVK